MPARFLREILAPARERPGENLIAMFQTEPILFLQSLASGWLTWLMQAITAMGYPPFNVAVIGGVLLAIDLRRGIVLAQFVILTNLITDVAKAAFDLPRPINVDSRVIDPRLDLPNLTPWRARGAAGFLAALDGDVVAAFRTIPGRSRGFPSGHVSTTVALWGGLSLLFRRRLLVVAGALLVPLMALSRMYLGRHFAADALGGAVLGALMVALAWLVVLSPGAPAPLVELRRLASLVPWRRVAVLVWLLAAPLVLVLASDAIDAQRAGHLLGVNVAFLVLSSRGAPEATTGISRAVARVALGSAFGVVAYFALHALESSPAVGGAGPAVAVLAGSLLTFAIIWPTVVLGKRLGLYG